jgi:hypothetical protein
MKTMKFKKGIQQKKGVENDTIKVLHIFVRLSL